MSKIPVSVFWFRRDLRLTDNHGLYLALKSNNPVLPVFIFDTNILDELNDKEDKRVNFIYQTLVKINEELISKAGSSLLVIHDNPQDAFQKILSLFEVKEVFTNHDYEPYAIERDKKVSHLLKEKSISFHSFKDQVIFEKSEILKMDGNPYTVFTPYSRVWKEKWDASEPDFYPAEKLTRQFLKTNPFSFPSLSQIGFKKNDPHVPPPEIDRKLISSYEETRNIPSIHGTTRLSVHLRFGTISIRKAVKTAKELNEQWLLELIWREFFMMILFHFPKVVTENFKEKYNAINWRNNEKEFGLWRTGKTGYPIVDAGMRELNETGFMHNRVRMITASFLSKHLLIDWRWGEAYFAKKLLDYELSSNNGNWQWAAGCGCDAAPYFRIFNPSLQTKRFDPQLIYIKKWIKGFEKYHIPPMVEHEFARKRALSVYQKALNK